MEPGPLTRSPDADKGHLCLCSSDSERRLGKRGSGGSVEIVKQGGVASGRRRHSRGGAGRTSLIAKSGPQTNFAYSWIFCFCMCMYICICICIYIYQSAKF